MATIRLAFWLNLMTAVLFLIYAGLGLYSYWIPDPRDSHGGLYGMFGAILFTSTSMLFGLVAYALDKGWRHKWLLQLVPVLIIAIIFATP